MKFSVASISLALTLASFGVEAHQLPSRFALARRGDQFVTGPCTTDSDCQQGCCAFTTGLCAGPGVAQTNADGGCGFGSAAPNCNVAAALGLSECVSGAVNGDLSDPGVQSAAQFVSQLDNIPFTPTTSSSSSSSDNAAAAPAAAPASTAGTGTEFVTEACTSDSDCQQGCCAFSTGKCAGPGVAQTNADGGCGFGSPAPNCNVAAALGLSECVAGAVNGDLSSPQIQAAAQFVSQLDGIPFTPARA